MSRREREVKTRKERSNHRQKRKTRTRHRRGGEGATEDERKTIFFGWTKEDGEDNIKGIPTRSTGEPKTTFEYICRMKSPVETSKIAICLALVMLLGIACQAHNTYSMKGKYRWRAGKRSHYSQTNHLRAQPSFSNLFPEISKLQSVSLLQFIVFLSITRLRSTSFFHKFDKFGHFCIQTFFSEGRNEH